MTRILGIDPGSRVTGYGLIEVQENRLIYIDSGCIKIAENELSMRLLHIFEGICQLIETFAPDEVSIEKIFTLPNNPSSALKLGHARGAAMVAAASHHKPVAEYSAREVKLATVGYGAAKKTQVQHMVTELLALSATPQSDAADALAVAICHTSHQRSSPHLGQQRRARRHKRRSFI